MKARAGAACAALVIAIAACTHNSSTTKEPVQPAKKPAPAAAAKPTPPKADPAPAKPAAALADDPNCAAFPKLPGEPPQTAPGQNLVLTRIMKPCTLSSGDKGYDPATPYLAMGFPCTGGGGRILITGHHYANPQMLSFVFATDCQMAPATKDDAERSLRKAFGLPTTTKLAAYTPFVVQFWELPGMTDSDVGYSLDMRSAPAIDGLWRKLQKHEPVRVRLYGRENTWVEGGSFYFVEGDIHLTGRTAFQLSVASVKALSKDEVAEVKTRCEALKPKRNCADVF